MAFCFTGEFNGVCSECAVLINNVDAACLHGLGAVIRRVSHGRQLRRRFSDAGRGGTVRTGATTTRVGKPPKVEAAGGLDPSNLVPSEFTPRHRPALRRSE
jgi:hypothetical protein